MTDLRVLGPLELRTADGRPLLSLHAQPKRLGLLAYLALMQRGGSCRRDTLLALFWPRLDEAHGRAALRQAVYHLRQVLGDPAIVSGPLDELALDPAVVRCDAIAFQEALGAGLAETAMTHYRGDLLEGFHLRDTPGFDEWRERERSRLRAQAATAAWSVATGCAARGDVEAAARWGRSALALAHDDEVLLQRYLRLLEQLGDRVRAVLEYEAFARRVLRDYDIEPTVETRGIIEAIRLHITLESPALPAAERETPRGVSSPGDSPAAAPLPSAAERPNRQPPARMSRLAAVAMLGLTVLAALAAWWVVR